MTLHHTPSFSETEEEVSVVIGPLDVLCGRDKHAFHNPGNKRFHGIVDKHLSRYVNAPSRAGKSAIIHTVMDLMKESGARFLKRQEQPGGDADVDGDDNSSIVYTELNADQAYKKIGHAFRDMALKNKNKSENASAATPVRRKRAAEEDANSSDATFHSSSKRIRHPSPFFPSANISMPEPNVACSQLPQNLHSMAHSTAIENERMAFPTVPRQEPWYHPLRGQFADGAVTPPPSLHPCKTLEKSPVRSSLEAPALPQPLTRWTSHTLSMSPDDLGLLMTCLNRTTTSAGASPSSSPSVVVSTTSICRSKEEFDALMTTLTRGTTSTLTSLSSSTAALPNHDVTRDGPSLPAATPLLRPFESMSPEDVTTLLDCLTSSHGNTASV